MAQTLNFVLYHIISHVSYHLALSFDKDMLKNAEDRFYFYHRNLFYLK